MTTPALPGLPSRGRTYAFMAGVVATTLTLAVVLPLALGDRPDDVVASEGTQEFGAGESPLEAGVDPASPVPGASTGVLLDPVTGQPLPADQQPGALPAAPGAGAPAPGGPAAPGTPGGRTTARTASDQGVTADTVKVGIFLIDFGGANEIGAGVDGYDVPTQERYARAYVDEINATGGVAGRRVVPVFRTVDILSLQTMRDACTSFGQTDKVFAVASVLGVYADPILVCAQQQRLPFLANDGAASSYYTQSRNYVITTQPSTLRTNLNMVRELVRVGETKGKKVGVVYYDGYLLPDNQKMLAELRRNGVDVVEGQLSLDLATAVRQLPVIARDFCAKGVELVLLGTNKLYAERFVEAVDGNPGCTPAYALSDFDFATAGDSFLEDVRASFFRRALVVTASRVGEGRVGQPEQPAAARCREVAERRLRIRLDRNTAENNDYFSTTALCGVLKVLEEGMARAGTNPTRDSFVQAVQGLTSLENPFYGPAGFSRGRTDATDVVRVSQAFADCRCWKPQTAFAQAAFR